MRAARVAAKAPCCERCDEPISDTRRRDYPHLTVCLECLTEAERGDLEAELNSAARVQRQMLPPRRIERDGWEIEILWEPFGAVSGDHVDVVEPSRAGAPLHLLLGDVAGKGLGASLLQSQLHGLFRALAPDDIPLGELLRKTNEHFHRATLPNCFATVAALRLLPQGRLTLANAGHPRPLIADRRGVRPIEDASVPLGVLGDAAFGERELRLEPGDTLLLYTDGWTEAERGNEMYGVGRAAAALRRYRKLPLGDLLSACRADVEAFLRGERRGDDLTLLAVRRSS